MSDLGHNMWKVFQYLLGGNTQLAEYSHPKFGTFRFEKGLGWSLGWKGRIKLDDSQIDVVFGSDGLPPSDEMIESLDHFIESWESHRMDIRDYIEERLNSDEWSVEPNRPPPDALVPSSINILWPERPNLLIIYFEYPGDEDERAWHVTLDGSKPVDFAYDH